MEADIPFVNRRIGPRKAFRSPAEREEGGKAKGGLVVFIGEKFENNVLDAVVDRENAFLWVVLSSESGKMGVVMLCPP